MKALNVRNMRNSRQSGFTIIELVVVILLLGILTATALPRFMDVTTEAHDSVVQATYGGLQTGGALFRAQWTGEGRPTGVVSGFGDGTLVASTTGRAAGDAVDAVATTVGSLDTTSECTEVYSLLLQSGAASVGDGAVVENSVWTADNIDAPADQGALDAAVTAGFDFLAGQNAGVCTYHYVADSARVTLGAEPTITYTASTGQWAVNIP